MSLLNTLAEQIAALKTREHQLEEAIEELIEAMEYHDEQGELSDEGRYALDRAKALLMDPADLMVD